MGKSHAALLLLIGLVSPIWALPSALRPTRPDVMPPLWGRWRVVRQDSTDGPKRLIDCGYFGWEFEFGDGWYRSFQPPWDSEIDPPEGPYWINQSTQPWTLKMTRLGFSCIWKIEGRYLYLIDICPRRDWVPLNFEISDGTFGLTYDLYVLVRIK
jgi:hypothetical protein